MTGPATPPPPPGPGRPAVQPLDPNSAKGREVAERLTTTLAHLELAVLERESLAAQIGQAA